MWPLASVTVAEAAIYGYVSLYYVMLYGRRRERPEYLWFGLLAAALAVYALGAHMLITAETVAQGCRALEVKALGLIPGSALTVAFCHHLVGRGRARAMWLAWAWAALGLTLTAGGLLFDAGTPAPPPTWGFAAAPDYPEAALSTAGQVYWLLGWGLVSYAFLLLLRHGRADRHTRLICYASAVNLAAGAHDVCIHLMSLRSIYLLEHASMLSALAMSYLLLQRFARTSEALAHRKGELLRSRDALRRTRRALSQSEQLAAVGELSAVIAHEVRNPLAIIKNAVSGLRRERMSAGDRSTLLSILGEEVGRLNRLVDDLLSYARPVAPQGRATDIEELVTGAVAQAREAAPEPAIEVELHIERGSDRVHGDPALLGRAVTHVVENAIHALSPGGRLEVRSREILVNGQEGVALDFRDNGVGMTEEVRTRAFSPFFTTRPSGTGLGLAIVEQVIRSHGGRVEISSEPERGSTVSLLLPLRPEDVDDDEGRPAPVSDRPGPEDEA